MAFLSAPPSPAPPAAFDLARVRPLVVEERAHGANTGSRLEWWYFTGQLWDARETPAACETKTLPAGAPPPLVGTQLTFFDGRSKDGERGLLGHAALTDPRARKHVAALRVDRLTKDGSAFLAHAATGFLDVALADWKLLELGRKPDMRWLADFGTADAHLTLELEPRAEDLWLHGRDGVVDKVGGHRNFYYSFPFIPARGVLVENGKTRRAVCGSMWFDHEIDVFAGHEVRWNWFSVRFPSGEAYMIYEVTDAKGESTITGEMKSGVAPAAALSEVKATPGRKTCLASGRCYAMDWTLSFVEPGSKHSTRLSLQAAVDEQEMTPGAELGAKGEAAIGRPYWEGLASVSRERGEGAGAGAGRDVRGGASSDKGFAYVEMVAP